MEARNYIEYIMKKHGMMKLVAVDHAAKTLGVTRGAVYHWLNGTRGTPEIAKKLMEVLVRIDEA